MIAIWVLLALLGWCVLSVPLAILVGRSLAGRSERKLAAQPDFDLVA